jgi:protein-S-isoprenylcysteine O-methyltransferase Ste14
VTAATRALGAALVVIGTLLAARSAMLLAGRGRPKRGPEPAFVIAGPYRRVRNPMAGGLLVAAAGLALLARSPALAVATALAALASHAWIVRVEEPRLAARFGAAYAAYLRCVPRWMPRSARPQEAPDDARF